MKKDYREIDLAAGQNIESAIAEFSSYKRNNELVSCSFNGKMLYSDIDDVDSAFKKITGKTKAEFDEAACKRSEEYEAREKEYI